jgi:hypothetical protein
MATIMRLVDKIRHVSSTIRQQVAADNPERRF